MKAKIIIEGEIVQDIGYRYYLSELALSYGLERFRALNTEDGNQVHVFIEGDEGTVKEFCEYVKSHYPREASVDRVKVEDYKGYVPPIESFALVFNMGQSRKFIESAKRVENSILDESQKTRDELGSVIRDESQKTRETVRDESKKTRDVLGSIIREESQQTRETVSDESQQTRKELGNIIRDESQKTRSSLEKSRSDMRGYTEYRFSKIEEDIGRIKNRIGMT